MPKRLLDRCQPDSIGEFRLAAKRRFDDGLALAMVGQRTGAIYLWGYTAEMLLKAAYFSSLGIAENAVLTMAHHIQPAIQRGQSLGIAWPNQGKGHNIRAWSELLVLSRAASLTPYSPAFGLDLQRHGQRFEPFWRETLRYRKNHAYLHEVRQVREAVEWLLVHSSML